MSCTKFLDDGIERDTFGGEDGSKPSNQKDIKLQTVEKIQKLLGFAIRHSSGGILIPAKMVRLAKS